jgi:hypothetical protein
LFPYNFYFYYFWAALPQSKIRGNDPFTNKSVDIFEIVTVLSLTSSSSVPITTFVTAVFSTVETLPFNVDTSVSTVVILLPYEVIVDSAVANLGLISFTVFSTAVTLFVTPVMFVLTVEITVPTWVITSALSPKSPILVSV